MPIRLQINADEDFFLISNVHLNFTFKGQIRADIAEFLSDKLASSNNTGCYHYHKSTADSMFNCGSHCYTISNVLKYGRQLWRKQLVRQTEF